MKISSPRKEYMRKYNKEYWDKNKEEISQKRKDEDYYKIYYRNNEKYRTYMREWYKKDKLNNPEKAKEKQRRDYELAKLSLRNRYTNIKFHAKKKGLDCFKNHSEFVKWFEAQNKRCFYCGVEEQFSVFTHKKVLHIDRKDNNKGYTEDNVCLACFICNQVKSNLLTEDEMKIIGKNIIKIKWQKLA